MILWSRWKTDPQMTCTAAPLQMASAMVTIWGSAFQHIFHADHFMIFLLMLLKKWFRMSLILHIYNFRNKTYIYLCVFKPGYVWCFNSVRKVQLKYWTDSFAQLRTAAILLTLCSYTFSSRMRIDPYPAIISQHVVISSQSTKKCNLFTVNTLFTTLFIIIFCQKSVRTSLLDWTFIVC